MEWTDSSWVIFLVSAGIGFVVGSFYWKWMAKKGTDVSEQEAEKVLRIFEQKRRQRGIKADE